jgi:pimeloyl-ACP methyl ester carboxylesterase
MLPMEIYLQEHGYRVINLRFHPVGRSIEQISESALPPALSGLDPHVKIHFVTHSMGAIILRRYLAQHNVPNLGRVVMLGPPNHGSQFVDWVKPSPLLCFIIGARVLELGTSPDDLPARLGPVNFECGVIAGDLCINPLSPFIFHEPNDGKVAVENTRVAGMRDFLVVHVPHTWLIWQKNVFRQTVHFLASGEFDHKAFPGTRQKP